MAAVKRGERVALADAPHRVGVVTGVRGYFAVVGFDPPLGTQIVPLRDLDVLAPEPEEADDA